MWGQLAGAAPGLVLAVSTSGTAVKPCPGNSGVLCGNIKVPLYSERSAPGQPHRHFKEYLHTDSSAAALKPIVAMEGGPGYPSTGSAASYLFMIGSLRQRHDLILMDQRGIGGSDAIKCGAVQDYDGLVRPKDFPAVVAACAKRLGAKANAFGSAAVAKDLKAVLERFQVTKVNLYGDSYGSYAAQVFAVHHPGFVRDLVLDATYNQQFNPFEPEAAAALRRADPLPRTRGRNSCLLRAFYSSRFRDLCHCWPEVQVARTFVGYEL